MSQNKYPNEERVKSYCDAPTVNIVKLLMMTKVNDKMLPVWYYGY